MVQHVTGSHDLGGVVSNTISSTNTPVSMDERLQLWSNSWEVFSSAPVFGWGSKWLERWYQTRYAHIQYTLLHNGYLEILVRYGLFGAAVMAFILGVFIRAVWRARKAVIFGSGGYPHNLDYVRLYQRTFLYGSCATATATGDFITIAGAAGARLGNLQCAWRSSDVALSASSVRRWRE